MVLVKPMEVLDMVAEEAVVDSAAVVDQVVPELVEVLEEDVQEAVEEEGAVVAALVGDLVEALEEISESSLEMLYVNQAGIHST